MFYTKIGFSIIVVGLLSTTVFAGSGHKHGRSMESATMNQETMDDHSMHNMGGSPHSEKHDSEGSAVGKPASVVQATRTITVVMRDTMRYEFTPKPNIKAGEVVRFVVLNKGNIPHEFSIGDEKEQVSHRKMMQKMPGMTHSDGNTVSVFPGKSKELTWRFSGDSEVVFACNVPGHFEAGMFKKTTLLN